jgi:integrase
VVEHTRSLRQSDYVFPGDRRKGPINDTALLKMVDLMNSAAEKAGLPRWTDPKEVGRDATPHGFRSSFRDWVSEETNFPSDLAEAALAHIKGDKVEAAYQRGTMFEKRRKLMTAWAAYCGKPVDNIKVVRPQFGSRP